MNSVLPETLQSLAFPSRRERLATFKVVQLRISNARSEEHRELPMMFGAQTVSPAFPAVHACISVVHPSWFLAIVNTYDV